MFGTIEARAAPRIAAEDGCAGAGSPTLGGGADLPPLTSRVPPRSNELDGPEACLEHSSGKMSSDEDVVRGEPGRSRDAASLVRRALDAEAVSPRAVQELVETLSLYEHELRAQNDSLLEAEARLQRSLQRFEALYEHAPVGYVSLDDEDRVTAVNRTAAALLGLPREAMLGQPLTRWLTERSADDLHLQLRNLAGGVRAAVVEVELDPERIPARSGVWLEVRSVTPPSGAEGEATWCTLADITDRRRAEQALARASRLQAVSTLAAGVTHDFNDLLFPIQTNLELLARELPEDSELREMAVEGRDAVRRAGELAQRMMSFAREEPYERRPTDFAEVVRETVHLHRELTAPGVRLELHVVGDAHHVLGDRAQLAQVVMNLVLNAQEATAPTGRVEVTLERRLGGGRETVLTVQDSGVGIAEPTLDRLFEPFFTTRRDGRGLGLAAVAAIVRQHGGSIDVRSEVGVGSTFTVTLPSCDAPRATPEPAPPAQSSTRAMTVLVVDDERLVRSAAARVLRRCGYETLTAEGGEAALELLDRDEGVDFVVLDMRMPGMSGPEVFDAIAARQPDLPIAIATGQSESAAVHDLRARGAVGVLSKPFDIEDLKGLIRGSVEGERSQS